MTGNGVFTFTYDHANRLAGVWDGEVLVAEFGYDGLDRRVKKTVGEVSTFYHYDPAGKLIAETDESGAPLRDYIYLEDEPVAVKIYGAQAEIYYYINNHLGTPQQMVDSAGTVVWQADYLPFGKAEVDPSSTVENNIRFPGQYYDEESGLHYNWQRYYDPSTGRYLTPDPIGLAGGINLYSYSFQNPVNYTDPFGLDVIVTLYPGASGLGHVGIGVNTPQTTGFYPTPDASPWDVATGQPVPGETRPDLRNPQQSITIPTTPAQDQAVQDFIDNLTANPGEYDLNDRNCATTVQDALGSGGINTPETILPRTLMRNLQQQFGGQQ